MVPVACGISKTGPDKCSSLVMKIFKMKQLNSSAYKLHVTDFELYKSTIQKGQWCSQPSVITDTGRFSTTYGTNGEID